MSEPCPRHPLVPEFLLARFADDTGLVMMERWDRGRRRTASVAEAATAAGSYAVVEIGGASPDFARLLGEVEGRAALVVERIVGGAFPPPGPDRAYLALLLAVRLVLGRGPRAALAETAAVLAEVIASHIPDDAAAPEPAATPEPVASTGEIEVLVPEEASARLTLSSAPRLARLLFARTWQLIRFPRPQLLTGDTPVVLWSRPGPGRSSPAGLGAADEVRVPLDPRHALVLARKAPAGEVVRDLDDRHAGALNRTVAEAARQWMFYHPAADPLGEVELARA
jgi:Protein of unknown function (DUF4238)